MSRGGGRRLVGVAALLAAGALGAPGSTADIRALVTPYLEAGAGGAVADVVGAAYAAAGAPKAGPAAYESVSVMLLPYSASFAAELDAIKSGLRETASSYVAAHGRLTAAQRAYESALLGAGGGELIRGEVSDAHGRFRIVGVPAGRWLLVAWREAPHPVSARKIPGAEASRFKDNWERTGYSAVGYWRLDLELRPGETVSVSLHDRNGWLTVVREAQRLPADAPKPAPTGRRRQGATR